MLIHRKATGEPEGILWRAEEHDYSPESTDSARINATLLSLVRNEELGELVKTMKDLERTWNHKFNYPWTFLNDKPFTEEFKRKTQEATKAKCYYGKDYAFFCFIILCPSIVDIG
jgi:mannosyltransferase